MYISKWLKGALILASLVLLCAWAFQVDNAWARAGGGGSMGSRGSRSSSPPRSYTPPSTSKPTQPSPGATTPRPGMTPPPSQPSSFWRSFGGGMLGGLAGGLLFSSLFGGPSAHGGMGGGSGGGIGLFDIILLCGIGYLIYWYIKRKRQAAATESYYQSSSQPVQMPYTYPPAYDTPQPQPQEQGDRDLEQGLAYVRQMDSSFDETRFQDQCMDAFFKVQGAYANRDMSTVKNLLTVEMYGILQGDAEKLKAEHQINRLDNIAVRSVDITEAWQESGQDFITVRIYANLLDYTVDEASNQVLSGSKTDPVKFEEYWTFTRPVGNNPWQLSAIQQPA
ncbi:MAG: Tim44 domain-containing protein [Desulfobaccales bacterium]